MGHVADNVERCLKAIEISRCAINRIHEEAVGHLCGTLGRAMRLESGTVAGLQYAGRLHDIGKILLSDAILENTGAFDTAEWAAMREHTRLGSEILWPCDDPLVRLAAIVAEFHHERWDGSGYPDGLAGEAIPPEARIVGICDVYQALREVRPYKPSYSHEQAMRIILEGDEKGRTRPSHFEPALHAAFRAHSDLIRDASDEFASGAAELPGLRRMFA